MTGPRRRFTLGWTIPLALVMAALLPGSASAAGSWDCEASALRGSVLSTPQLDPLAADAGQPTCQPDEAGIVTPPGLPLPLLLNGLHAETTLDGPVDAQVAGASARADDVQVRSTPSMPLPTPDFGDFAEIPVTVPLVGTIEVDLRPALEGLLEPAPERQLLSAQDVEGSVTARCAGGAPQLSGGSSIAAMAIDGESVPVDEPTTETVALIDTQEIDPSDVDPAQVILPAGVDLSDVQVVLELVLDTLPTIEVPPTVAQVTVVPKQEIAAAGQLTQRALDADVSIAGQSVADLAVGEATVGTGDVVCPAPPIVDPPDDEDPGDDNADDGADGLVPPTGGQLPPGAAAATAALGCTTRPLALIDAVIRGKRVRLVGAADRRFVGRRVAIKFLASGKTVASPKVRSNGVFTASAPLPRRSIRATNRARYQAAIGSERSLALKLVRRVLVTSTRVLGGRVTIRGRVLGPLATPRQPVAIKRRVSCVKWVTVKRVRPAANGRFRVTIDAPERGSVAVYRAQTRVARSRSRSGLAPTFSLPSFVEG